MALVDTGAEFSLFSADLAEALGLSLLDGPARSLKSLGGELTGYAHHVEIEIAYGWSLGSLEVLFAERNIPRNLIGRSDFLQHVILGVSEHTETIYLLDATARQ